MSKRTAALDSFQNWTWLTRNEVLHSFRYGYGFSTQTGGDTYVWFESLHIKRHDQGGLFESSHSRTQIWTFFSCDLLWLWVLIEHLDMLVDHHEWKKNRRCTGICVNAFYLERKPLLLWSIWKSQMFYSFIWKMDFDWASEFYNFMNDWASDGMGQQQVLLLFFFLNIFFGSLQILLS